MDSKSIIIGAIVIAVCILPFILMSINIKRRERKKISLFKNIVNENNCILSKYEICGDFVIGIDETRKYIFFNKQLKDNVLKEIINLHEIQHCKVKNGARVVTSKNGTYNVIDKLELIFNPLDKNKKEIVLEFFNVNNNTQLIDELQSIEKWSKIINDCIKSKK